MLIGQTWRSWAWVRGTLQPWCALRWLNSSTRSTKTSMNDCAVMSPSNSSFWRRIRYHVEIPGIYMLYFIRQSYSLLLLEFLQISVDVDFQVKVMHKQLLLFHNAVSAYFAGNQQQLEQTLRQFNVKLKPPGSDKPSWLEEQWSLSQCKETLKHGNLKMDGWKCKEMHQMWFVWMINTIEVDVFMLPNPGKCFI